MLTAGTVVWPGVLTLHLCIGTTEKSSHADLTPGLISLQPTISHGKVWSLSSVGHEMPLARDPWLLRQMFWSHGPFHTHHGVSRWRGTTQSCWALSLVQCPSSRQCCLASTGARLGVSELVVSRSMHRPHNVWGVMPSDGKSCCAIWGTAMLHWVFKQLHNICGWGMCSCSVLRVHPQFNVKAATDNCSVGMSPENTPNFIDGLAIWHTAYP